MNDVIVFKVARYWMITSIINVQEKLFLSDVTCNNHNVFFFLNFTIVSFLFPLQTVSLYFHVNKNKLQLCVPAVLAPVSLRNTHSKISILWLVGRQMPDPAMLTTTEQLFYVTN